MKSWSIVLLLLISFNCVAQNRNSVWCFGDSSGIDFNNVANPVPIATSVVSKGSCTSVCDSIGQLLFYANNRAGNGPQSTRVWNKLNALMQNGDSITGEGAFNELTIVPIDSNQFYLFITCTVFPGNQGFYYCKIDMTQNGGLGAVVQKNVQLLNFDMADCVQAVKHGNGRDWWVITKRSSNNFTQLNEFYVYLISPSGISNPIIQSFGNATDMDIQKIVFNNNADKLMLINFRGYMAEYDFNRCTGIISNPNIIFPELTTNYNRYFWEGAYSPNDSLFYATSEWNTFPQDTSRLLQFNLFAANIPASCDTLFQSRNPNVFGAIRLAPDSKIYMTSFYNWGFPAFPYPDSVYNQYNMNLSVINYPDSLGGACDFQPFTYYLGGKRTYGGLPNNPNYQLGPLSGSICDTLAVTVNTIENLKSNPGLVVYFHPQWQTAFINAKALTGKKYSMSVYDIIGNVIFKEEGNLINGYFTKDLNMQRFAKGIYIVNLQTEKENLVRKFLRE